MTELEIAQANASELRQEITRLCDAIRKHWKANPSMTLLDHELYDALPGGPFTHRVPRQEMDTCSIYVPRSDADRNK